MNHGIVTLRELLGDFKIEEPRKEEAKRIAIENKPPHKQPPKVLGDPTRTPVSRSAASMFFRANWLTAMPSEKPLVESVTDLKLQIAALKTKNELLTRENTTLRKQLEKARKPQLKPKPGAPLVIPPPPVDTTKLDLLEKLRSLK